MYVHLILQAVCKAIINSKAAGPKGSNEYVLSKVFNGAKVYFNYTGEAKCLDLAQADDIGSSMWDYQVQ